MADKKQKTKKITGHGNLNTSNLNSEVSECITLTYDVFHVPKVETVREIISAFEKITNGDDHASDVIIKNFEQSEQEFQIKYKIKKCESDEAARDTKTKLDKHIRKLGGQTTLTEDFDQEEKKAEKKSK